MKTKPAEFDSVLKLKRFLSEISTISYSFFQLNKKFGDIEKIDPSNYSEMYDVYIGLIEETREVIKKYDEFRSS
jgi:hypothetical protein